MKHELVVIIVDEKSIVHKLNIAGNNILDTICILNDKTFLVVGSNKNDENIGLVMKQYEYKDNIFNLLSEKDENYKKMNENDYLRISSTIELSNGIVVLSTSGYVNQKLCGTISIFEK